MDKKNIHYQNALHLIKNNNVSDAVKELKLCLKFNSNDTAALNLLGLAYYLKCRFDKAEAKWRKSLSIRREKNKAADYLELITKSDFKELRQRYKKIIFNDEVDEKSKRAFLEDITAEHEELIEPYLILALLYKKKGNYEQALAYLYQAYDLDSGNKNIKDYILECESKNQKKSFLNFDFFNESNISKALMLTFLLSAAIILLININLLNPFQNEAIQTGQISDSTSQENEFITLESLNQQHREKENSESEPKSSGSTEENSAQSIFQNNEINSADEEIISADLNYINIHLTYPEMQQLLNQEKKDEKLEEYKTYLETSDPQQLFEEAYTDFRAENYSEAADKFTAIYSLSDVDYLKRESLYLLARSHEIREDYIQAEYYYREYLEQYQESNYYEVVLYNLGLMLDQIGRKESSRKILMRLRNELPYSQYNNSRVYDILNDEVE
jgi:tetratricopeptide (TPR) repeat protein